MAAKNRVPLLVKHMTMAILRKGGIDGGTQKEQFISAWNIARARLTQYGMLSQGSDKGPASNIRLASRGIKRETEHRRETGRSSKEQMFDSLFSLLVDDEIKGRDD
jgi:hypothetical protein